MSDLKRVRDDLEVIREAAGLGLPFGWEDVWLGLAFVPCGAFLSAWAAFGPSRYLRLGIVPTLFAVAAFAGLRYRYRQSTGRSPLRRREYTFGLATAALVGFSAWTFMTWERSHGVPLPLVGAAAVFFAGVICVVLALSHPGRRSCWAAAVVLFGYAFLIPYCTPRQIVMAAGVALVLVGLATAPILAWQLRAAERNHEPATD